MGVVEIVRRREFRIGTEVGRLAGVRCDVTIAWWSRRMRAAFALARRRGGVLCEGDAHCAAGGPQCGGDRQPYLTYHDYSLQQDFLSVRNIAMASISTRSSGRHNLASMPVDAGRGSSPCS